MKEHLAWPRAAWPVRIIFAAILAAATLLVFAAPRAAAVDGHLFDANLSLTGGCAVSEEDPVPDPGCPGGAHPPKAFDNVCGTAVDPHGDIYVASSAVGNGSGTNGRIDVFNPDGEYLTGFADTHQPCSLAVDSTGRVYVVEYAGKSVVLFKPDVYPPVAGSTYDPPETIHEVNLADGSGGTCTSAWSVAVDPSNDHLYVALACEILEYGAGGTTLLREGLGGSDEPGPIGIDVYGNNHDVYVSSVSQSIPPDPRVFVLDGTDGHVKCEIDGSETPSGGFGFEAGHAAVAVDQLNGDVYVDDISARQAVYQFAVEGSSCSFIGGLKHSLEEVQPFSDIAVDDPQVAGEAGYDSPNEGNVYVGSGASSGFSHLYAFVPRFTDPPEVEDQAAADVGEAEATLGAQLNPGGLDTEYHFEYTTEADFLASGYSNALRAPIPDATAEAAASFGPVSVTVVNLKAGTTYRFRLVASNEDGTTQGEGAPGEEGDDASFITYPAEVGLPDARAYELVTPPDTNGRIPTMAELASVNQNGFDTNLASPDHEGLVFGTEGGALPGTEGGGFHDTYEARRGAAGWQTTFTGLSGVQAPEPYVGGIAPDHLYSFWRVATSKGSLAAGNYLRGSSGALEPIGVGTLGKDLEATGRWITSGGGHVIFVSSAHLEASAAPNGNPAVYDRTPGGTTHVISLMPGGAPFASGAEYQGTAADGTAVAFEVGGTLYLRVDNSQTLSVASGNPTFGGISDEGDRLVYLIPEEAPKGIEPPHGDVFVYDSSGENTIPVGSGGKSILVNVSPDGSHVYFVSPLQLDGGEGEAGAMNLYAWDGSAVSFIATVTERDVFGEPAKGINDKMTDGLGLWVNGAVNPVRTGNNGPGADPSRTTPDGSVFVFESRANLTDYDSEGHSEIYRYDADAGSLLCLSCNPTAVAAESDAQLQSNPGAQFDPFPPVNALAKIENVTSDGQAVFFQSADPLVVGDVDGKIDVYEWKAEGAGTCGTKGGCLALISSGRSAANDYLYAMTPDGRDVFFETGDLLVTQDRDGTPSIYDARVNGGFPSPASPAPPCSEDACQGPPDAVPGLPGAGGLTSATSRGAGNVKPRRCGKRRRKVRRHGKLRCVPKHAKGRLPHKGAVR
jgi:hypothetical protein